MNVHGLEIREKIITHYCKCVKCVRGLKCFSAMKCKKIPKQSIHTISTISILRQSQISHHDPSRFSFIRTDRPTGWRRYVRFEIRSVHLIYPLWTPVWPIWDVLLYVTTNDLTILNIRFQPWSEPAHTHYCPKVSKHPGGTWLQFSSFTCSFYYVYVYYVICLRLVHCSVYQCNTSAG